MRSERQYSPIDRLLAEFDTALKVVAARPRGRRATPESVKSVGISDSEQQLSAKLMRVNHSGEVAAQALYRGQALVARDPQLRAELLQAADEEHDHLAWCEQRSAELGGRASLLTPCWYAGSFLIGMTAGLAGDKTSLGFLAETERQVTEHLDGHLERLPPGDSQSRAILEQMREDEMAHAAGAIARGGAPLPALLQKAMRAASRVMTSTAYRL